MALATQCPMCETVFRITTAQAAVKSGTVRCGQCFSVFNALDVLVRVEDLEFDRDVSPVFDDEPDAVETATGPDTPMPVEVAGRADHDADEFDVDPVVESSQSPATAREWWLPGKGESIVTSPPTPFEEPRPAPSLSDRRLNVGWPQDRDAESSIDRDAAEGPARSTAERITLTALSVVALIALLGQAAYLWRDEIASRWPSTRSTFESVCANLRCQVQYPTHLDSITIESTNVEAPSANSTTYILTTLLRNRDTLDIRYPSLLLTLTDAQDQPILRRVLRPEDYLAATPSQRGFAAGSELPIRVTFEISDLRFLGYRLERFYP